MAVTILGSKAYQSGGFAASVNSSGDPIDFGTTSGRWIHVVVWESNSGESINSVSIAGGGTLTAESDVASPLGDGGHLRCFRMQGDGASAVPSGVATVTATCSGNAGRVQMVVTWGHSASAIGASANPGGISNANPSWTLSGATANDLFVVSGLTTAQTTSGGNDWTSPYVTTSAAAGSTLGVWSNESVAGMRHMWSVNRAGASGSTSLGLSISGYQYTPGSNGFAFTVTGAVSAPVLSSGTLSNITSTSADVGVSIDVASATLYRYRSTNSTESAATIKASGTTSTVTASGAQGPFSTTGMTAGGTYYVHFVANDGTTDSNVVSVGPIYPGTWRPTSDVSVSGWSVTGAANNAAAMSEDESAADATKDASYSTSPALTTTYQGKSAALDRSLPAGTYTFKVRSKVSSGTGWMRLRLLNGSDVEQGASADQAITSTLTTYTLTVTTSGTSTRIVDEYKI